MLGSWILFSSAIGERSRAWTAPSVGPVFISGAALGVIHKHIKLKRNAWPQRDFPAGPESVCVYVSVGVVEEWSGMGSRGWN